MRAAIMRKTDTEISNAVKILRHFPTYVLLMYCLPFSKHIFYKKYNVFGQYSSGIFYVRVNKTKPEIETK
jgi:hypothetical protein